MDYPSLPPVATRLVALRLPRLPLHTRSRYAHVTWLVHGLLYVYILPAHVYYHVYPRLYLHTVYLYVAVVYLTTLLPVTLHTRGCTLHTPRVPDTRLVYTPAYARAPHTVTVHMLVAGYSLPHTRYVAVATFTVYAAVGYTRIYAHCRFAVPHTRYTYRPLHVYCHFPRLVYRWLRIYIYIAHGYVAPVTFYVALVVVTTFTTYVYVGSRSPPRVTFGFTVTLHTGSYGWLVTGYRLRYRSHFVVITFTLRLFTLTFLPAFALHALPVGCVTLLIYLLRFDYGLRFLLPACLGLPVPLRLPQFWLAFDLPLHFGFPVLRILVDFRPVVAIYVVGLHHLRLRYVIYFTVYIVTFTLQLLLLLLHLILICCCYCCDLIDLRCVVVDI